jgi:hypothetical protein
MPLYCQRDIASNGEYENNRHLEDSGVSISPSQIVFFFFFFFLEIYKAERFWDVLGVYERSGECIKKGNKELKERDHSYPDLPTAQIPLVQETVI